jgi:hypothetical protein
MLRSPMMQPVNRAEKLDALVGEVEDLLGQLPQSLDPAIAALRDKVDDGIFAAWTAISSERLRIQRAVMQRSPLKVAAILSVALLLACAVRIFANRQTRPARH